MIAWFQEEHVCQPLSSVSTEEERVGGLRGPIDGKVGVGPLLEMTQLLHS